MTSGDVSSGTLSFLFTDLADSTLLWEQSIYSHVLPRQQAAAAAAFAKLVDAGPTCEDCGEPLLDNDGPLCDRCGRTE